MPTLAIKSSGGDATSLSGAEALISDNSSAWILDYQEALNDTTDSTINASMAGGGSISVTVAAAYRHGGVFGAGARRTSNTNVGINIATASVVTVSDLEISSSGTSHVNTIYCGTSGATGIFKRCLIRRSHDNAGSNQMIIAGGPATLKFWNCFLIQRLPASNKAITNNYNAGDVTEFLNCTGISFNAGGSYSIMNATGTGTCRAANTLIFDGSASGHAAWGAGTTAVGNGYNGSDDTSSPGTTAYDSLVIADTIVSGTSGSEDLHFLTRAVQTTYAGADLSATIGDSLDVERHTRAGGWYAGADEVLPAAPTVDAAPAPDASYLVGAAYSVDHAATGTGTLTFSTTGGAVPSGTSLTGATGVVAGTLTTPEAVSYQLTVTDAWSQTGNRTFTSTINAALHGTPGGYERSAKLGRCHFRHAGY